MFTQKAKIYTTSAALALAVALAGSVAQAALTVSAAVGGSPTGSIYDNFNSLALGNAAQVSSTGIGVSFAPDGQVVQGATAQNAAPYLSNNNGALFGDANGADTSNYLSAGIGQVILDFSSLGPQQYLGLLWGSVDAYNTLDFYNGNTLVGSIVGTDFWPGANGDQGVNGTYYVNVSSTLDFNKVVASSSQYAFEIDNVSYNNNGGPGGQEVPEPATLALFGLGLAGLGVMARRRKPD